MVSGVVVAALLAAAIPAAGADHETDPSAID
jgi:hypothetical protein